MAQDVLDRFSPATRRGSGAASRRPRRPRPAPGRRSARGSTPSSSHPPARARPCRRSSGRSTGWPASRVPADKLKRCRVLYVSPMKALAVDVERNLRSPLVGIGHAADPARSAAPGHHRGGPVRRHPGQASAAPSPAPPPTSSSRRPSRCSSCSPQQRPRGAHRRRDGHPRRGARRRRHQARRPPRALASSGSTPCSTGRPSGSGCRPPSRPVEEVARFLAGGRPVEIVQPPSTKEWDLQVVVPVAGHVRARRAHRRPVRSGRRRACSVPRSGRTSRSGSSTSSPSTARPWSSPTPAGSPSGSPPGSTRSGRTASTARAAEASDDPDDGPGRPADGRARAPGIPGRCGPRPR